MCQDHDSCTVILTALQCKELVKNVFENTADLSRLCSYLNIPRKKRNATSASECFLMSKDPRKFRSMIFYLDYIGDTSLADSIVDYAEPPAGMSTQVLSKACTYIQNAVSFFYQF